MFGYTSGMRAYVITPVRLARRGRKWPPFYAIRAMWRVLRLGFIPLSVSILWPFVGDPRAMRLAGRWIKSADVVAVDRSLGWGEGMVEEWALALELGKPRFYLDV